MTRLQLIVFVARKISKIFRTFPQFEGRGKYEKYVQNILGWIY